MTQLHIEGVSGGFSTYCLAVSREAVSHCWLVSVDRYPMDLACEM